MFISGEALQELADLTIIFSDQRHDELWKVQIHNINCEYIILNPGDSLPEKIFTARSIFIYTHALPLFFERVFPSLTKPITLLSHNSDHGVDNNYLEYLNSDKINKWFCQNRLTNHPKLFSLPIGIANSCWDWGDSKIMDEVINEGYIDSNPYFIYANFSKGDGLRYERRKDCYDILSENGIIMQESTDYKSYLQELKKHKFCLSPEGNGIDCYRTWEALYMRTIPICKRSVMVEEFAKTFPIYIVDDWKDFDIDDVWSSYDSFNWDNWYKLDFETYCRGIEL